MRTVSAEPDDAGELVDRARRARAAEQHDIVVRAADRRMDQAAGLLAEARRLLSRRRGLGVRVPVERQHAIADEALDEGQRAPRRRRVHVDHAPAAERPLDEDVVADHRGADPLDQPLPLGPGEHPVAERRTRRGCTVPHALETRTENAASASGKPLRVLLEDPRATRRARGRCRRRGAPARCASGCRACGRRWRDGPRRSSVSRTAPGRSRDCSSRRPRDPPRGARSA